MDLPCDNGHSLVIFVIEGMQVKESQGRLLVPGLSNQEEIQQDTSIKEIQMNSSISSNRIISRKKDLMTKANTRITCVLVSRFLYFFVPVTELSLLSCNLHPKTYGKEILLPKELWLRISLLSQSFLLPYHIVLSLGMKMIP